MKITIFGSGYVGLVTGTCLADVGHDVMCVDVDEDKIARLNNGEVPIYEPGLEPMLKQNMEAGRLQFTTDAAKAVKYGKLQFIAVGTPPDEDGSADLKYVLKVAETIATHMVMDFWNNDRDHEGLDHFHFISDTGLLSVDDVQAIARKVW